MDHNQRDTEQSPSDRGDHVRCLNCKRVWADHWNWGCCDSRCRFNKPGDGRRSTLAKHERYLTSDMPEAQAAKRIETIISPIEKEQLQVKQELYSFFAKPQEGHCICGILRSSGKCKYH